MQPAAPNRRNNVRLVSAWATVVLALGVAVITTLAGLTGAYLQRLTAKDQLVHEETEPWRKVLVETTGAYIDAWHEFRSFLRSRSIESDEALPFDAKAKEQIEPLGTKCAQTIDKVMLAFGKTTECGKAAAQLDEEIWDLKQVVLKTPTGWDATTKCKIAGLLNAVNDAHKEFVEKAHIACQPIRWQEPTGETTTKTPARGGIELGSSVRASAARLCLCLCQATFFENAAGTPAL